MSSFVLAVMLARVCVSEAGWHGHDECAVIVHALTAQADRRGIPLHHQVCAYAPNSCNRDRTDARRWIAHLHPESARPPSGWPRLSWEPHRAKFAAMVVTVMRTQAGEVPNPCPGAIHWGSRSCQRCKTRMEESGYVRAHCGLANKWWRRAT